MSNTTANNAKSSTASLITRHAHLISLVWSNHATAADLAELDCVRKALGVSRPPRDKPATRKHKHVTYD